MKKKLQIKTLILGIIVGGIIFGSIGVVATNYLLKAEDVEYRNNKNLQDAIDELYGMANNQSGKDLYKVETNNISATNNSISISVTKTEPTLTCRVKDINDNVVGTEVISNNTCTITGLQSNKPYTYEIIGTQGANTGVLATGSKTTNQFRGTILSTTTIDGIPSSGLIGVAYLDPSDLTVSCNASSTLEKRMGYYTGCMRWFVYNNVNGKYYMLLDHNTDAKATYSDTITKLNNLKETWGNSIGADNIRMITGSEIKSITNNQSWTITGSTILFNGLGSGQAQNSNVYWWLFDQLNQSTSYGGNSDNTSIHGYWTSSCFSTGLESVTSCSSSGWRVCTRGELSADNTNAAYNGLRPVIEIRL